MTCRTIEVLLVLSFIYSCVSGGQGVGLSIKDLLPDLRTRSSRSGALVVSAGSFCVNFDWHVAHCAPSASRPPARPRHHWRRSAREVFSMRRFPKHLCSFVCDICLQERVGVRRAEGAFLQASRAEALLVPRESHSVTGGGHYRRAAHRRLHQRHLRLIRCAQRALLCTMGAHSHTLNEHRVGLNCLNSLM